MDDDSHNYSELAEEYEGRTLAEALANPFYTVAGFYQALGGTVGLQTIRAAVRSGRIRSVRVGRKRLIPKTELPRLAQLREIR